MDHPVRWGGVRGAPRRSAVPGERSAKVAIAVAGAGALTALLLGPPQGVALAGLAVVMAFVVRVLPEAFLGLLMICGPLNSTPVATTVTQFVPVGLTTIALVGVAASAAHGAWRRRAEPLRVPRTLLAFALLVAVLIAASFHSPDPDGALGKVIAFETVTALAFLSPLLIINGRRSLVRFALIVVAMGLGVALFAEQTGHDSHPLTLPGSDNEIVVGEFAGLGLVAIVAFLWPLTPGLWKLVWVPPALVMLPALIGAGSRGALIGTTVATVVALALLLRRRETRGPALAVVCALVVAAPSIWATSPPAARAKYLATFDVSSAGQALNAGGGERQEILSAGVDLFRENPMGVGTDGYAKLTGFEWPHNIFVELGAEVGVLGIALFAFLVAGIVANVARPIRNGSIEILGVACIALVPAMLSLSSFDLNGNRVMWLLLGVALAAGAQARVREPRQARAPVASPIAAFAPRPAWSSPLRPARSPGRPAANARQPRTWPSRRPAIAYRAPTAAVGGAESLLFRVGEAALGVTLVVLTARLMAPEGRGLFALASLCALLCALPLGSVWSASAVEIAKQRVPLPELLGALATIAVVGGTVIAGLAIAATPVIGAPWWIVVFPALLAPLALIARYQEGVFQGLGHLRAVNLMHLARAGLPVAVLAIPLMLGVSDRTVIMLWVVALSVLPVLFVGSVLRQAGGIAAPRTPGLIGRLVRTGAQLLPANTAVLLNSRLALLFLAAFATTAAVGVYSVAIAAAEVVYLASFALMSSTFTAIGSGSPERSLDVTARALRHAALLHLVGCALLVPALFLALPTIVGPGYGDVAALLLVLTPGLVAQAGYWVLHTYFTVQLARPRLIVRVSLVSLATNIACAAALVPPLGIWGAAIAASIANIVSATVMIRVFLDVSELPASSIVPTGAEVRDYRDLARTVVAAARTRLSSARTTT